MKKSVKIVLLVLLVLQLGFALWASPDMFSDPRMWQWLLWGAVAGVILAETVINRGKGHRRD